jgi:hypothetical protein
MDHMAVRHREQGFKRPMFSRDALDQSIPAMTRVGS